jgi:hypothetical protein
MTLHRVTRGTLLLTSINQPWVDSSLQSPVNAVLPSAGEKIGLPETASMAPWRVSPKTEDDALPLLSSFDRVLHLIS